MGLVCNKSFKQVRKSIGTKANKILTFLEAHPAELGLPGYKTVDWTTKQNNIYERLQGLCYDLVEEISNLDEIEVPDFVRNSKK